MTEINRYKITLVVDSDSHPRKWIADVMNENLHEDEELIDWEIVELLSSSNDNPS